MKKFGIGFLFLSLSLVVAACAQEEGKVMEPDGSHTPPPSQTQVSTVEAQLKAHPMFQSIIRDANGELGVDEAFLLKHATVFSAEALQMPTDVAIQIEQAIAKANSLIKPPPVDLSGGELPKVNAACNNPTTNCLATTPAGYTFDQSTGTYNRVLSCRAHLAGYVGISITYNSPQVVASCPHCCPAGDCSPWNSGRSPQGTCYAN